MGKDEAQREVKHHEAAAARAPSTEKRRQHELAAQLIREANDIPKPHKFSRDPNALWARAEKYQRKPK